MYPKQFELMPWSYPHSHSKKTILPRCHSTSLQKLRWTQTCGFYTTDLNPAYNQVSHSKEQILPITMCKESMVKYMRIREWNCNIISDELAIPQETFKRILPWKEWAYILDKNWAWIAGSLQVKLLWTDWKAEVGRVREDKRRREKMGE